MREGRTEVLTQLVMQAALGTIGRMAPAGLVVLSRGVTVGVAVTLAVPAVRDPVQMAQALRTEQHAKQHSDQPGPGVQQAISAQSVHQPSKPLRAQLTGWASTTR